MNTLKDHQIVKIAGKEYIFQNRINENKEILAGFNSLVYTKFGISFEQVGGEFEPHVLVDGDTVCANVSVNQVPFFYRGERRFYIQLGGVATADDYQGRGLSRFLIEHIIEEWKDKCDAIYLLANDTVLDFYPKFGFIAQDEYLYSINENELCNTKENMVKLDMEQEDARKLVREKYGQGNPYSELYMIENEPIYSFYYERMKKDHVYYIPAYDVIVCAEAEDEEVICYDVLGMPNKEQELLGNDAIGNGEVKLNEVVPGERKVNLEEIASTVYYALSVEKKLNGLTFGFTPTQKDGLICKKREEENTTLFVHKDKECIFMEHKLMFPILSEA